jgi:hypothetical protein
MAFRSINAGTIRGGDSVGNALRICSALPNGGQLVTLLDAGNYITGLPKAEQLLDLTQPPREE